MKKLLSSLDNIFIKKMHAWGIPILRVSLGLVFLWFGVLKLFGLSPVAELVSSTYFFFPQNTFLIILGVWEVAIGIGLLSRYALRLTLALLWLQMAGTLVAPFFAPELFFRRW